LEVASAGELFQALAAGCSPDQIIFAGPGKTGEVLGQHIKAFVTPCEGLCVDPPN